MAAVLEQESQREVSREMNIQGDSTSEMSHESKRATVEEPQAAAPAVPPGAPSFPDGGLRAWLVVLGAACTFFVAFGTLTTFGVFESYYVSHQLKNKTSSDIAWIGTFEIFCMFAFGPFVGRLFDRYGAQPIVFVGSVLAVFSFMMVSLCTEFYQFFLAQAVLFGFCNAMLFFPAMGCVNHWFAKRRGVAIGLAAAGSSIGGVVWPIVLNKCLNHSNLGFGWSLRLFAFLFIPFLVVANLCLRTRLPPRQGGPLIELDQFKDKLFSFTVFGLAFAFWGMFVPYVFVPSFGVATGISEDTSLYLSSVLNGGSFIGRVNGGLLADRFGRFNLLIAAVLSSGCLCLIWIGCSTQASAWVLSALFGVSSGAMISLQAAAIADICSDMKKIGTMMGMCMGVISIAGLTGSPIAGAIPNPGGMYRGACAFGGCSLFVGGCLLMVARLKKHPKLFAVA